MRKYKPIPGTGEPLTAIATQAACRWTRDRWGSYSAGCCRDRVMCAMVWRYCPYCGKYIKWVEGGRPC